MDKQGQIASKMVEIYLGSIVIMIIVFSSFFFSGMLVARANADAVAVNTGLECNNNLNAILKSDFIFDEKTSIRLGRSSDIAADLFTIQNYFDELDFNKFNLQAYNHCPNFNDYELGKDEILKDMCRDSEDTIQNSNPEGGIIEQECALVIAQSPDCSDPPCRKFIVMEVYE